MRFFTGDQYKRRYEPELDNVDALQHYLQHGRHEGRDTGFPFDDPAQYLDHPFNADVKADPFWGTRPDLHWLLAGSREGRPYLKTSSPDPSPGSFTLPTESGIVAPKLPGNFFMSGLRTPKGLLLGTYRPAELYFFNGGLFERLLKLPTESVYMLHGPTPDGGYLFTTECPAQVWRCSNDQFNDWKCVFYRTEPESVAFDILPFRGGLSVFTSNRAWGEAQTVYVSDANGLKWDHWTEAKAPLYGGCTDGQTYYFVGWRERNGLRLPCIVDHNGAVVLIADDSWKEQKINYASVKDGMFTLGLNNIEELIDDGTRRNGYVMSHAPFHSGINCKPPFIMQTEAVESGRFAVASIWNESGYPNPELVWSRDGRADWKKIADIPFPSVQSMEIIPEGVLLYGGQKDSFGQVYFHKFQ